MRTIAIFLLLFVSPAFSQYSYVTEKPGTAARAGEFNLFRITVLHQGTPAYRIERSLPFDVPYPLIAINEKSGVLALRYVFDGFVEVYDAEGAKIWENNFFKEEGPDYERTIGAVVGTTSVVFLVSGLHRENAVVQKYSLQGALLWSAPLPFPFGYELALSDDEQTIIAGSYRPDHDGVRQSSLFLNSEGMRQGEVELLFRNAEFSDTDDRVALHSEREVVIVERKETRHIARAEKQSNGIITNILWDGKELIVQESEVVTPVGAKRHFANPVIIRYSASLQMITKETLTGISFTNSVLQRNEGTVTLVLDGGKRSIPVK